MSELTHDTEDGFHEIQLSGKQLVFLFMATTVVSVVIFLCGVLVGRGVRAERGGEDMDAVAAAPAPVQQPQAAEAPPPAAEPPVPAAEALTAHDRLQQKVTPNEQMKAPEPVRAEVPAAEPPATPPARQPDAVRTAGAVGTDGAGPKAGSWVIQVHALQNRDAANAFVRSLSSKGYPAFLLNPTAGSPQIYRVQIGAYQDRDEAETIARRLEKEEQFRPAVKRR